MGTAGKVNGGGKPAATAGGTAAVDRIVAPAPTEIADLAAACVRQVEAAVGVTLDFAPETLPLLDHYVTQARASVHDRPEALPLLAQSVGAYLGEVVRRRYVSWWGPLGDEPTDWQIQLETAYLVVRPVALAHATLLRGEGGDDELPGDVDTSVLFGSLELDEDDRARVAARLAELPPVREEEFWSTATMLEVLDIAVDEIRAHRLGEGEPELALGPEDYED